MGAFCWLSRRIDSTRDKTAGNFPDSNLQPLALDEAMPPPPDRDSHETLQIIGWLLFIGSALCFTVSTWQSGDVTGIMGSLLFLVACFVFLWPLVSDRG